jgi:hypothetical protein
MAWVLAWVLLPLLLLFVVFFWLAYDYPTGPKVQKMPHLLALYSLLVLLASVEVLLLVVRLDAAGLASVLELGDYTSHSVPSS